MRRSHRALLLGLALIAACGSEPPAAPDDWARSPAEAQGIDSAALAELVEEAVRRDVGIHAIGVARHGVLVLDAVFHPYDGERPHDIASCTKSLTSTAVGLALADGTLSGLDAPAVGFFPDDDIAHLDDRKRAMTLEHLLTMQSGLACEDPASTLAMRASGDWVGFALGMEMAEPPGSSWRYCNANSHILSGVVTEATGQPTDRFLRERLFAPLGVGSVVWPVDPRGVPIGYGDVRMSAPDLVRVGQLFLDGGRWEDEPLLDAEWVHAATRNQVASHPDGEEYGYHWWPQGSLLFMARGRGGQFLVVLPSLDLVVVTFGASSPPQLETYLELLEGYLLPAIRSSSPLPENPEAEALLHDALRRAAMPPSAEPVGGLPSMAAEVSGVRYATADNPLGWDSVAVRFDDASTTGSATFAVAIDGTAYPMQVGLDAVPRVTRGVRLSTDGRHDDVDIALEGTWTDAETLVLRYDTIDRIDAGTITMRFEPDASSVDVAVTEETYLESSVELRGAAP